MSITDAQVEAACRAWHRYSSTFREPDMRESMRAALEAADAAAWRPIEEAPRDGTAVLVYAPPYQDLSAIQCCAAYHPDGGWCVDELRQVTMFHPLPAPPVTT